jgi:hypothetical protein
MVSDATSADESGLTPGVADTAQPAGAAGSDAGEAAKRAEARECMPCRGSGKVISNLGGERSERSCPWCHGTGVRESDVDAQSAWRDAKRASGPDAADETRREAE